MFHQLLIIKPAYQHGASYHPLLHLHALPGGPQQLKAQGPGPTHPTDRGWLGDSPRLAVGRSFLIQQFGSHTILTYWYSILLVKLAISSWL